MEVFQMVKTYSIGDCSKLTQVSQKQLRSWQERGYLTDIARSVSGERAYRRYTEEQVALIKRIKAFQDEGYILPVAVKKANEVM